MLIPNHPHDELLAALASADADATGDETLTSHVTSCIRCSGVVADLSVLRASLAELPDVRPSRPLRLVPALEPDDASARNDDRLGGWVRRIFAPLATAGAALALVGLVGTTAPLTTDGFQNVGDQLGGADGAAGAPAEEAAGEAPAETDATRGSEVAPMATGDQVVAGDDSSPDSYGFSGESTAVEDRDEPEDTEALTSLPAERSPWPMVLFTGVALLVGAVLLRWIVVPRAG